MTYLVKRNWGHFSRVKYCIKNLTLGLRKFWCPDALKLFSFKNPPLITFLAYIKVSVKCSKINDETKTYSVSC